MSPLQGLSINEMDTTAYHHNLSNFPDENPAPIMRCTKEGVLLYANKGSALVLERWQCEVNQRIPKSLREVCATCLESQSTYEHKVEVKRHIYSLLFIPVKEEGYVNIYGFDITDSERAQAALKEVHEELEARVKSRTRELEKAKLAAEFASHIKTEFLSHMSHELRTPLNAILGFGQLLAMKKVGESFTEDDQLNVQEVMDGGQHLFGLINDILDLSSLESGRIALSIEAVSLDSVLAECIGKTQSLFHNEGIQLNNLMPTGIDYQIYVDRKRLIQAIFNLLTNAVKYNRLNGDVTISSILLADGHIRVMITDTGQGIDDDLKRHIYEPFMHASDSSDEVSGTGIGNVITKRLMEAMGGNIGFESTLGEGSCFWLDIPLAD